VTAVELPLLQRQAYVDGKWVDADSGETFPVVDPATGDVIAEVPRTGAAETRRALAAAERALRPKTGLAFCDASPTSCSSTRTTSRGSW